jgi:hypothetical protein
MNEASWQTPGEVVIAGHGGDVMAPESPPRSRAEDRMGHADVAFTTKQYIQGGLEADRQVAWLPEGAAGGADVSSWSWRVFWMRRAASAPMRW